MPMTPHNERERFALTIRRYTRVAAIIADLLMMAEAGAVVQSTPGEAMSAATAKALPFVSPIFGNNMVLQRGKPDAIWGWSDPGDIVRVQIGEHSATASAGPDRRWLVKTQ